MQGRRVRRYDELDERGLRVVRNFVIDIVLSMTLIGSVLLLVAYIVGG